MTVAVPRVPRISPGGQSHPHHICPQKVQKQAAVPPDCSAGEGQRGKDKRVRRSSSPWEAMVLLRLQHHPPPAPHPLRGSLCPPCWGNRAAQLPGGQQLPSCPVWARPDGCTLPCSGAAGQGPCQELDVPSASSSKTLQEGHWPISPSPGGKDLFVLDHLPSSPSPSHLILEELGLVLTTRQSLHKAKNLGINERRQSNVSGWRPP